MSIPMAGATLGKYLKTVFDLGSVAGKKVAERVAQSGRLAAIGSGSAEEAAQAMQSFPLGRLAGALPIPVSAYQTAARNAPEIAGIAANVATQAATPAVVSYLTQGITQSSQPFTNQPYQPGSLPLTNYQAGEAYLQQQRFLHSMGINQQRADADAYHMRSRLNLEQMKQSKNPVYGNSLPQSEMYADPFAQPVPIYQ
jgi:hypothetical protein